MTRVLHTTTASGEEIDKIIARLEVPLEGVKRGHAVISLLSLAIFIMNPMISGDNMQKALTEMSQFICMSMDGMEVDEETGIIDKRLLN